MKTYSILLFTLLSHVLTAQTLFLYDIKSGFNGSGAQNLGILNNSLLVSAKTGTGELYKIDSGQNTYSLVKNVEVDPAYGVAQLNDKMVFMAKPTAHELWVTDGTSAGTAKLNTNFDFYSAFYVSDFVKLNNKLYFSCVDSSYLVNGTGVLRQSIRETDGTSAGNKRIFSFVTNQFVLSGQGPSELTLFNNKIYFLASTNVNRGDVWVTDGTAANTYKVADSPIDTFNQSNYSELTATTNGLYLTTSETTLSGSKSELFKVDVVNNTLIPLKTSTTQLLDVYISHDTLLYFVGPDSTGTGPGVWITDGTVQGTRMLIQSSTLAPGFGLVVGFKVFNNKVYFTVIGGTAPALWATDGTYAGTTMIKSFSSTTLPSLYTTDEYAGMLFFSTGGVSSSSTDNNEYWKTDGTTAGTIRIGMSNPGQTAYANFVTLGNAIYFNGGMDQKGIEVWRYDTATVVVDTTGNDTTTSINNFNYPTTLKLYPNPANDQATLYSDAPSNDATYTLFDLVGNAVLKGTFANGKTIISLKGLTRGLYLCNVTNAEINTTLRLLIE